MTIKTANQVELLRNMAVNRGGYPVKRSHSRTFTSADAKGIFLATNCELTTAIRGEIYNYEVKKKSLGAGVYRLWLEMIDNV